ncbi:LamG-like jellyroll fold domain-containing protein [Salegentibacter sediminis]|uniref:LamG-like jellyroll fold domain-containing protein n=1 Tax=Salegentibacter sediminis TaxID=1930251 RepID=UPI0009BFE2C3|nr:LamG-like jellyroll fold domain-containing protein [Salegentibacter sediminis]
MKNYIKSSIGLLLLVIGFASCDYDNIDPLTQVDPGPDAGAPEINIQYPNEGTTIQVPEPVAAIDIRFEVKDDIEVDNIEVLVNGNQIASFNDFLDYRIVKQQVAFEQVTNGEHTLTIKATDIAGNTTSKTVNFSKEPPYTPRYAGEFFYMPFDADFTELVNIYMGEETGNPGITSNAYLGTGAYSGANDSYVSVPLKQEELGNEFTAAFWYKLDSSNDKAGILTATDDDDRNQGFRLFRETDNQDPEYQRFKLNIGTGDGEVWNDGGLIHKDNSEWVHIALSFSPAGTVIYFDGVAVGSTELTNAQFDWTGVEDLVVGSGLNFSGWGHNSDTSLIDELRLFNRALSAEEIAAMVDDAAVTLYMPFEGDYKDQVSNREVVVEGEPGLTEEAAAGTNAYAGAENAYLTLPTEGLQNEEFSATFWYKFDGSTENAGLIAISPEDTENPDAQNLRTSGLRFFRELRDGVPVLKLNVGTGAGESWNDGGAIGPYEGEWVHVAFTISSAQNETIVYIDGKPVNNNNLGGNSISWTGADLLSVMSGAPRFTGWGHLSDKSSMDELRFYNKALTQEEIQAEIGQ